MTLDITGQVIVKISRLYIEKLTQTKKILIFRLKLDKDLLLHPSLVHLDEVYRYFH